MENKVEGKKFFLMLAIVFPSLVCLGNVIAVLSGTTNYALFFWAGIFCGQILIVTIPRTSEGIKANNMTIRKAQN